MTPPSTLPSVAVGELVREIPRTARADMRVPVRVYADEALWAQIATDRTLEQLVNVATLPGIVGHVYGMPDAHEGYGFPVGGVAATEHPTACRPWRRVDIISPGGVGYDINCGVRLLASSSTLDDVRPHLEAVVHDLSRASRRVRAAASQRWTLTPPSWTRAGEGCRFLLSRGLAAPGGPGRAPRRTARWPRRTRARCRRAPRSAATISSGTLGSGNHFVEVQVVDEVVRRRGGARRTASRRGQVTVLIHTGSRGLGHQVCTDTCARWIR